MSIFDRLFNRDVSKQLAEVGTELAIKDDNMSMLVERLAELELALEDQGWDKLTGLSGQEFSRASLGIINNLARLYFLKNPLIKRAVLTQTQYVFGQGVNIAGVNPLVDEVIQDFLDDTKNKQELTEHQSAMTKESELQCFANLFFVFFTNISNGRVRVRTIPMDEIVEIISNPEDSKDVWYYKRSWTTNSLNTTTGAMISGIHTAYYPDWRYKPSAGYPASIGGIEVERFHPVYHVAVNRLSDMRFGVSEIYAGIDWARAYKEFLENWASIVKAHSRFAWRVTTKGGAAGVSSVKATLASTLSTGTETNPSPPTGSTAVMTEGVKMDAMRTGGAQTKAADSRYLRLMVSSATGIFEHYLTGDPSTGNLATTKAMEMPMLIMFRDRQQLWTSILSEIFDFVIFQAVKAGRLPGTIETNDYGEEYVVLADDTENADPALHGQPMNDHVAIDFPNILEQDVSARVKAVVSAATLDGKPLAGTMEMKIVTTLLLEALGLDDIDEIVNKMFPLGEEPEEETPVEAFTTILGKISKMLIEADDKKPISERMRPADWKREYAGGVPHWATDMTPSKFAQEFAELMATDKIGSVLEVGVGNGRDSIHFARSGVTTSSIDIVPAAVKLAKKNAKDAEVDVDIRVANAEKLPFDDSSFGAYFSLSVLHSTDLTKSLPEMYRVLKSDGLAFVYIYGDTQKADGSMTDIISYDQYLTTLQGLGFEVMDSYTDQEDEFDEFGEKHRLLIVSLKKKEAD